MSTHCAYCAQNIPFYNEIAEDSRSNGSQVCITAVFPESEDDVGQYLQAQRLRVEAIGRTDLMQFQVAAPPTMILIDDRGRVLDFWVGILGEREKQSLLGAIRKETSNSL